MAKGIVKETPTATHGKVTVVISDNEEAGYGAELTFRPIPEVPVAKYDALEFTITSASTCDVTGTLRSPRGKVTDDPSNRGGTVKITDPDPNDFKVKEGAELPFSFILPSEDPNLFPRLDDIIQVIITGDNSAVFVKVAWGER